MKLIRSDTGQVSFQGIGKSPCRPSYLSGIPPVQSVRHPPGSYHGVTITTPSLPSAKVGEAYPSQLGAAQGAAPYSWALYSGNLPAGLALAPTDEISGTPTGARALYQFEVLVTDSAGGTESRTIDLIVPPPAGYLGKQQGTASGGGCAAGTQGGWILTTILLMLAAGVWRRRRA